MPKKAIWSHKWGKLSNEQVWNVFLPSGITLDSMAIFKPGCFQILCMLFLSFFKQILLAMKKKLCFKQTEGYFKKVITISVSAKGRLVLFLMGKWCKDLKNNTRDRKSCAVKYSVVFSLIMGWGHRCCFPDRVYTFFGKKKSLSLGTVKGGQNMPKC